MTSELILLTTPLQLSLLKVARKPIYWIPGWFNYFYFLSGNFQFNSFQTSSPQFHCLQRCTHFIRTVVEKASFPSSPFQIRVCYLLVSQFPLTLLRPFTLLSRSSLRGHHSCSLCPATLATAFGVWQIYQLFNYQSQIEWNQSLKPWKIFLKIKFGLARESDWNHGRRSF